MTSYVLCKTLVRWLCSRSQPGIKVIIRDLRGHLLHTVTFLLKYVKQIMGRGIEKSQCSIKLPPLSNAADTYSFSNKDKAATLNDYFC